jgi:hypothetical protein
MTLNSGSGEERLRTITSSTEWKTTVCKGGERLSRHWEVWRPFMKRNFMDSSNDMAEMHSFFHHCTTANDM